MTGSEVMPLADAVNDASSGTPWKYVKGAKWAAPAASTGTFEKVQGESVLVKTAELWTNVTS